MRTRRIAIVAAAVAGVGAIAAIPALATLSAQEADQAAVTTAMGLGHQGGQGGQGAQAGTRLQDGTGTQAAAGRSGHGNGQGGQGTGTGLTGYASGTLTDAQADAVIFMIEEEKLAHDVYTTLAEVYDDQVVFSRIASSEAQHMTQMRAIAEVYGLDDPSSDVVGEFSNPDLQAMYDELVASGSESLSAALEVGQAIERDDIARIDEADNGLDAPDLQHVYDQLTAASERHLVAFGG
jgi:hypothetical protein